MKAFKTGETLTIQVSYYTSASSYDEQQNNFHRDAKNNTEFVQTVSAQSGANQSTSAIIAFVQPLAAQITQPKIGQMSQILKLATLPKVNSRTQK